ncbi:hypothetical protein BSL78_07095 [Apostichopus japonicus]|uniref:Uncharacterized protein n=1 Tax=Stichopus japonicus TaxID=307972 RepID=A0A2G8L6W5_STIJA|nr:hypothetical protein BSL78_07095 [Apostichopus japonicus]
MPFSAGHCVKGRSYFVKRVVRSEPAYGAGGLEMPGYYVGNSLAEQLLTHYQNHRYAPLDGSLDIPQSNELHQRAQTLGVVSVQESAAIGGQGGLKPSNTDPRKMESLPPDGDSRQVLTPGRSSSHGPATHFPLLTRTTIERSIPLRRRDPSHDVTLPQCIVTQNTLSNKSELELHRNSTAYARDKVRKSLKVMYPPKAIFMKGYPQPVNFYTTKFPHVVLEKDLRKQQGKFLDHKIRSLKYSNGRPVELKRSEGLRHNYSHNKPELASLEKLVNHSALIRLRNTKTVSGWLGGLHCYPKQLHEKEDEIPP